MNIVDLGSGAPVVIIPGVQGRWEWMRPGVDALARRCRVITFSLADEPSCGSSAAGADGFSCYVAQVLDAMESAGIREAAICGVSYGGAIAAAFAARYPERVSSLVLVSAIPPSWRPDARVCFYLRAPRALSPLFLLGSLRLYPEIAAASRGVPAGIGAAARHGWNVLTHMFSPSRMARRVEWLAHADFSDLSRVTCPTLLVTGSPELERVVPVRLTREYLRIWPHAQVATIERTGHLGILTRPEAFAGAVATFVESTSPEAATRRRVG